MGTTIEKKNPHLDEAAALLPEVGVMFLFLFMLGQIRYG
jgi:hypothetical protein